MSGTWDGVERRRAGRPWADLQRPLRVAVFTTSYPRNDRDPSGRFVAEAVSFLRASGVHVELVVPELRGEGGVVEKLRRAPWRAPGLLLRSVRALRRVDADLVHALAPVGRRRRPGAQAVRAHAARLGLGRSLLRPGARAERSLARRCNRPPRADRDRGLAPARRRSRVRRARRPRDPERDHRSGTHRTARSRRRSSTRAACRPRRASRSSSRRAQA